MTRIPESKEFILKRVCRVPVQVPASMPAPNAASEASGGLTPWTSSVAATEAPRVMEPSAVMSGNAKMRKLMNTPSARSERMQPMVKVVVSIGRRNTFLEFTRRSLKTQSLSWALIQAQRDFVQIRLGIAGQVGVLWEVL